MLEVLNKRNAPEWLELTSHAWVIAPESQAEIAQALQLAERRASLMTNTWSDHVLGLALFTVWAATPRPTPGCRAASNTIPHGKTGPCNSLVLAMARQLVRHT